MPINKLEKSAASVNSLSLKAYLEPDEVAHLEKAANNLRDRLLIRLLFHLGCRVSEALGIGVEDINLPKGTVTIQHLKTRLNLSCPHCKARLGRKYIFCPECGDEVGKVVGEAREHRRIRTLPVDNDTLSMLKEYIQRGGPVVRDGKNLVFDINRHRVWQIIKECAQKAGLPKLINPETGKFHNVPFPVPEMLGWP